MKSFFIAAASLLLGLLVTWLALYSLSHLHLPISTRPATGCHELGQCPTYWWTYPLFFANLLGPAVLFGAAGFIGSRKRWSVRKWLWVFSAIGVLVILFYSAGYLAPLLN